MDLVECPINFCGYISRSGEDGLGIHLAIKQPRENETFLSRHMALFLELKPLTNREVTISRRLRCKKVTNATDQVTKYGLRKGHEEVANSLYQKYFEEFARSVEDGLEVGESGGQHQNNSHSSAHETICEVILKLNRDCGEKTCDELLEVLRTNMDWIVEFLKKTRSMKDVRHLIGETQKNNIEQFGFKKKTLISSTGLEYTLYVKNVMEVLGTQLSQTSNAELILDPETGSVVSHHMHGRVGTEACVAVKPFIQRCGNSDVFWKEPNIDCKRSFVGAVQLFSDKSQISLIAGSLYFYHLHATLLNFTEEVRSAHATSGRTIVAYLPVSFSLPAVESSRLKERRFGRIDTIRAVHESVRIALQPLAAVSLRGISVKTIDGTNRIQHPVVVSYVADFFEADDMLAVKREVSFLSPCHRCSIRKENFSTWHLAPRRTVNQTLPILNSLDEKVCLSAWKDLEELSILPLEPVLSFSRLETYHRRWILIIYSELNQCIAYHWGC